MPEVRTGYDSIANTGWTPDGKLGGGLHKQFRVFDTTISNAAARENDLTAAVTGAGDTFIPVTATGPNYPGGAVDIYSGGNTLVRGKGADVDGTLKGDINVVSAHSGVTIKGFVNEVPVTGDFTGRRYDEFAYTQIGHGGNVGGVVKLLNMEGDINVQALGGGDVTMIAGNGNSYNFVKIGHGSRDGGHAATSTYLQGGITVNATGDLIMEGGGRIRQLSRTSSGTTAQFRETSVSYAYAMIGHGGVSTDTTYKSGDIDVTVGGDLRMTSGRYGGAFVQIGHGGRSSQGMVGGTFTRTVSVRDEFGVSFNQTVGNQGGADVNLNPLTANITVDVEGDALLEHLTLLSGSDADEITSGSTAMSVSHVLIGHGGSNNTRGGTTSPLSRGDKTGDVTVTVKGDLTMGNGGGSDGGYTRIGHGLTSGDGGDSTAVNRAVLLSGNVLVDVGGNLLMNANAAAFSYGISKGIVSDPGGFWDGQEIYENRTQYNPVVIGHGGGYGANYIQVLTNVDVDVKVGGDLEMRSGKSVSGAYVQIGNGQNSGVTSSLTNNDNRGKFYGDVTVDVGGELKMSANPNGQGLVPEGALVGDAVHNVTSNYVLIGNGGLGLNDINYSEVGGNIMVTVGTDLTMEAADRKDPGEFFTATGVLYGSYVQIGNANSAENAEAKSITGDVTVQVGGDLMMKGGRNTGGAPSDPTKAEVNNSFVQIGNGGANSDGDVSGDITVRVGGDFTSDDENVSGAAQGTLANYVKVGHGDWMKEEPSKTGTGDRNGNIVVYVGNTANLDRTLIGHRDSAVSAGFPVDSGDTFIGVSRNNPFYGGAGQLIANNGSVFSSASDGLFGELRFYMPGRSSNLLSMDTRLNSDTVTFVGNEGGVNFAAPTEGAVRGTMGEMPSFQREDEIYLQPDWWSDNNNQGGGTAFPGGSLAEVNAPGGFTNLAGAPTAGSLGGGTAVNAHGELAYLDGGANSLGNYTLYYDAIETVAPLVPGGGGTGGGGSSIGGGGFSPPSVPPVVIPIFVPDVDLFNFLFFSQSGADLFGYTERDYLIMGDVVDGGGDTQEGLEAQQPHWLFGVSSRVLTPEEEARERRRRARYQWQVSNGGRTFWVYDVNSRQYSSFRQFGSPHGPSVTQ